MARRRVPRWLVYALLGTSVAAILWLLVSTGGGADAAEHPLLVLGPNGVVWDEPAFGATPVELLLDAASRGLAVDVQGSGQQAYVEMIGGHRAGTGGDGGGWCYRVDEGDGRGYRSPAVGGGAYGLGSRAAVVWYWTNGGCDPFA